MRNVGLDEAQTEIKIGRRNINNLRYANETILMAESGEEAKSLLMRVKEESEKGSLKLNIKKNLRSWHLVPSVHGKEKGKRGRSDRLYFLLDDDYSHEIKRCLLIGKQAMRNLQCIEKQNHHFANKVVYNQSYGFSIAMMKCLRP